MNIDEFDRIFTSQFEGLYNRWRSVSLQLLSATGGINPTLFGAEGFNTGVVGFGIGG